MTRLLMLLLEAITVTTAKRSIKLRADMFLKVFIVVFI
jgi:hypothetical protein